MTNLVHNVSRKFVSQFVGRSRLYGGATFLTAVILLVVSTMIVIFAANMGKSYDKMTGNQARNKQAYEAAEAGIEFGISYLAKNESTIVASPSSGHINFSNSSTTNVALANGSSFSVVYTNPVANNYDILLLTSTGTNSSGSAAKVIRQKTKAKAILGTYPTTPIVAKGSIDLSGTANIVNLANNQTIQSGSSVSFSGSSQTTISSGVGSNVSGTGADVQANQSSLSGMSNNDFFATYFGTTSLSSVQSQFSNVYTNSVDTNYNSTLNGVTGTTIWINQTGGTTATISGSTTIGSAANPVLMVINGNLTLSGTVTIYGFVYIVGTPGINPVSGNITITGGIATIGNLSMSGSSTLTYDTSILNKLQSSSSMRYYAKVPGSWRDF